MVGSARAVDDDLAAAYDLQAQRLAARIADGETPVGWKVGCTSRAVQEQFGLDRPVCGRLMAPHVHASGTRLPIGAFIGPAVEAELVLRLGRSVVGPSPSDDELLAEIDSVAPGIEVHHYVFTGGVPTSEELIASNAIHAAVVVGPEQPFDGLDLALEGCGLWVDEELRASGIGAELLGQGPLATLRWLAGHLHRRGHRLSAGDLVLPGSAVPLVRLRAGDTVRATFTRLGSCTATFPDS
jgi:2-keto-4-pentenoate hydratase